VTKVKSILLGLFLILSSGTAVSEEQAGMRYWEGIDKEAIKTESGLQYKILINGTGRKPTVKSRVKVHYRGMLLDGSVFDSSYSSDEPVTFGLKRVITGWTEGIQLMPKGSVFVFLIPPELAYGDKGAGVIPPGATLIFEVELFGFK
jgi:FKBP-type peptidyl-prolyl cis-trans isomerase FkpA